MLDINF